MGSLLQDHDLILPDEDNPQVLSLYEGKTVEDMCERVDLRICNTGSGRR